jgi:hypothetical protein
MADSFVTRSLVCEIGKDGRRQLMIRAGKSHKFTSNRKNRAAVPQRRALQSDRIAVYFNAVARLPEL